MRRQGFLPVSLLAGLFLLWGGGVCAQVQVGETFGVALDPAQKTAQQFHGGFYHLLRSDVLDARNYFAPQVAPYHYQDYRFSLAGPVNIPRLLSRRKKWFFALGVSWNSDTRPESGQGMVPTAAERSGDFRGSPLCTDAFRAQFSDCRVAESAWSRYGPALLASYPLPNAQGPGFNYAGSATRRNSARRYSGRLEWTPQGRWRAGVRLSHEVAPQKLPFQGSPLGNAPILRRCTNDAANLRLTTAINVKTFNAFSMTVSRGGQTDRAAAPQRRRNAGYDAPELFLDNPDGLLPAVSIASLTSYSAGRSPGYLSSSVIVRDDYARSAGQHEWRLAAQWVGSARTVEVSSLPAGSISFARGGNSTGNPVADALLGRFSSYQEGRAIPVLLGLNQLELSLADRWKKHARLVLDYGLIWLWTPLERRLNGPLANFSSDRFAPASVREVARDGTLVEGPGDPRNGVVTDDSGRLVRAPANNIVPRLGASWQPFKKHKLNVRAGASVAIDRARIDPALANNPPEETVTRLNGLLQNPAAATRVASRPPSLLALHAGFLNPNVYNANARVEQDWRRHLWAAEYRCSLGRHLVRQRNLNQLRPGALSGVKGINADALRPYKGYATITLRETAGKSSAHAMEFSVSPRKPVAGISYRLRYTFSKVLTDSAGEGALPQDNFNLRNDRGPAGFDRRQALILEYSYQPKFGAWMPPWAGLLLRNWEIYGGSTLTTGVPFDVVQPGDRAMMGGGVQRPDVVAQPALNRGDRSLQRYFNVEAFRSPAPGALGNAAHLLVYGPGTNNANLSLSRILALTKRLRAQLRADIINAFNHPSFNAIGTVFDPATYLLPSSTFGRVTAAGPGRSIQLTFKLVF